jgi:protein TonB
VHAIVVATIVWFAPRPAPRTSDLVYAYLLDAGQGSGGGASGAGTPDASAHADPPRAAPKARSPEPVSGPAPEVVLDHASVLSETPVVVAGESIEAPANGPATGEGDNRVRGAGAAGEVHGGGGSFGTGIGAGGGGNSAAHVDYAHAPLPLYPDYARRREQQGTVTLRVFVDEDGSVRDIEIAQSSGHDTLDEAALRTVRDRWRFRPARRAGATVASWVLVPVRFVLTDPR